jgi:predicted nucleic acid-binding protein
MSSKAFVDTNVLLRATHADADMYTQAARLLKQARRNYEELWISRQVIREYLVNVLRPGILSIPLTPSEAVIRVSRLRALFTIADDTDEVTTQLLALLQRFPGGGKQVHDTNIIATMLVNKIDTLITADVEDMRRFSTLVKLRSYYST